MESEITSRSILGDSNLIGLWYLTMLGCGRANKVFYAANHNLVYALDWASRCDFLEGAFIGDLFIGVGFAENTITFDTKLGPITRSEMGFGFLPNCNVFQALKAGRVIMQSCFDKLNVDHMFGTTPEPNKEALAYVRRLGLKMYGPVPNFCMYNGDYVGAYTSHISKDEWTKTKKNS